MRIAAKTAMIAVTTKQFHKKKPLAEPGRYFPLFLLPLALVSPLAQICPFLRAISVTCHYT